MTNQTAKRKTICDRLQELGYAREKSINFYGEELRLVTKPMPDGDGFAIEGVVRGSGHATRADSTLVNQHAAERTGQNCLSPSHSGTDLGGTR